MAATITLRIETASDLPKLIAQLKAAGIQVDFVDQAVKKSEADWKNYGASVREVDRAMEAIEEQAKTTQKAIKSASKNLGDGQGAKGEGLWNQAIGINQTLEIAKKLWAQVTRSIDVWAAAGNKAAKSMQRDLNDVKDVMTDLTALLFVTRDGEKTGIGKTVGRAAEGIRGLREIMTGIGDEEARLMQFNESRLQILKEIEAQEEQARIEKQIGNIKDIKQLEDLIELDQYLLRDTKKIMLTEDEIRSIATEINAAKQRKLELLAEEKQQQQELWAQIVEGAQAALRDEEELQARLRHRQQIEQDIAEIRRQAEEEIALHQREVGEGIVIERMRQHEEFLRQLLQAETLTNQQRFELEQELGHNIREQLTQQIDLINEKERVDREQIERIAKREKEAAKDEEKRLEAEKRRIQQLEALRVRSTQARLEAEQRAFEKIEQIELQKHREKELKKARITEERIKQELAFQKNVLQEQQAVQQILQSIDPRLIVRQISEQRAQQAALQFRQQNQQREQELVDAGDVRGLDKLERERRKAVQKARTSAFRDFSFGRLNPQEIVDAQNQLAQQQIQRLAQDKRVGELTLQALTEQLDALKQGVDNQIRMERAMDEIIRAIDRIKQEQDATTQRGQRQRAQIGRLRG